MVAKNLQNLNNLWQLLFKTSVIVYHWDDTNVCYKKKHNMTKNSWLKKFRWLDMLNYSEGVQSVRI